MTNYINEDPGISVQNLIRRLLEHALSILGVGILCALALGGYYIYKTKSAAVPQPVEAEGKISADELNELNQENYVLDQDSFSREINFLQEQIRRQDEYMQHSLLMSVDPYQAGIGEAIVQVSLKKGDMKDAVDLIAWYEKALKDGSYLAEIAERLDTEIEYLEECINFSGIYETSDAAVEMKQARIVAEAITSASSEKNNASSNFNIKVTGVDEDSASLVLEAVLGQLSAVAQEEAEKEDSALPAHTVTVIQKRVSTGIDEDLRQKQADTNLNYSSLVDQLTKINTALSNLKKPDIVSDPTQAGTVSKKKLLKYLLVGGAGGVLLMIMLYGLYFMFTDKLDSYRSLQERFHINHLGSFHSSDPAKRLLETDTLDMICANVQLYAEEKERILLAGCADQELIMQIGKVMAERFPGKQFETGGSIAGDLQTREWLSQSDAVVLIEERKQSRYSIIQQELKLLETVPVKLLGVVVG